MHHTILSTGCSLNIVGDFFEDFKILGSAPVALRTGLYAAFPSVSVIVRRRAARWQISLLQIWQSSENFQEKKT